MFFETRLGRIVPIVAMTLFVMLVQVLSLALMPSLSASEYRVFENPESAANSVIYILLILAFTLFVLMALKLKKGWVVSGVIFLAVISGVYYVLFAFLSPLPAFALSFGVVLLLYMFPEWYVIDLVGLLVCAGVSALFGISMEPLPVLLLLTMLAVYDAISVYKTRHMVTLAKGVMEIKAPLLFIVPRRIDYSFRKKGMKGSGSDDERGAYFLGLGDAIIPTVLVVSANWFLSVPHYGLFGLGVNGPALGAMLGTYLGFLVLSMTPRDKPQAGLPFLNGGAILGFVMGSLISGAALF